MKDYKYKFSVIIPVYNVQKYLEEAIESIINQTIGFENNIQLILVNDGSKDNSEEICLKYKDKYPKNIIYVKQKNSGVSIARNTGVEYAEGKYINFLDGDDKWSKNAFKKIWSYFEKKYEEIDILACRMRFFDAREDYHHLDYKFETTKVVNILEDYEYVHLHITSSIIKTEIAKKHKFDSNVKYAEDSNYVNEIILEKNKYGVLNETTHFYRRRIDESSAVQNKEKSTAWYTNTIEYVYKHLMELSIKKNGTIIPYIQYLIMYDLQWRIKGIIPDTLETSIKEQYIKEIISLLQKIDDYIICEQKKIFTEHKLYILSLKYGRDIRNELDYRKGKLYFNNIQVYNLRKNRTLLKVTKLDVKKNTLFIEGTVNCSLPRESYDIFININSKEKSKIELIEAKKSLYTKNTFAFKNDQIIYHYTYKIEIPLKDVKKIKFLMLYKNEVETGITVRFEKFGKLSEIDNCYSAIGGYILRYRKKNILIRKSRKKRIIAYELKYDKQLILNEKKIGIAIIRILHLINKLLFKEKEIWLISDREEKADDNGEHFFKYVNNVKNKNIKTYFVINKTSQDYSKIKRIGKTVDPKSLQYKRLFLKASKIISSQANDNVINAFGEDEVYYRDLLNFKFIFLQHGITKDDLSSWLKKQDKNIDIFITAAKPEYKSIINGDYYYTEKQVKLTGFPRYDGLENNTQKSILILPTQRRKLVEWNANDKYGKTYNPYFKESEFFKFYNNLINDKRLLEILKKNGYKIKLGLHPLLLKQSEDFKQNEMVEIIGKDIQYQKEFGENAIMVTDYSSVAFDFAYLRKLVIYAQFDKDTFYEGQVYEKGYYDYEKDGMGPVCYDYETTINEIIKATENDGKVEEKYLKRIEDFYAYSDKNNCERVYNEILKLD